jgi:hypothetical protein
VHLQKFKQFDGEKEENEAYPSSYREMVYKLCNVLAACFTFEFRCLANSSLEVRRDRRRQTEDSISNLRRLKLNNSIRRVVAMVRYWYSELLSWISRVLLETTPTRITQGIWRRQMVKLNDIIFH